MSLHLQNRLTFDLCLLFFTQYLVAE